MSRDFETWMGNFKDFIASYDYYADWDTIFKRADKFKFELNALNSLVGSEDIRGDFIELVGKQPCIRRAIPILLAKREPRILVYDQNRGDLVFDFSDENLSAQACALFMEQTGLFDLISNHISNNLYDYVTGIEAGLNSNGRKNRGGHAMENLVEDFLNKSGLQLETNKNTVKPKAGTYFKELETTVMQNWGLNMGPLTNERESTKRFDFVVFTDSVTYGIETNFYTGGGSKLNETARSYKQLAQEAKHIEHFEFVWITDGGGWRQAKHNLRETFESMEHIYSIADLESGIFDRIFTPGCE